MYQNLNQPIYFSVLQELQATTNYNASFDRCRNILKEIEKITQCRVLAYFSSFKNSLGVMDNDANFIEDLLRCRNQNLPLILILSSPGGYAVSAEKILSVCQTYAKMNKTTFFTLVPKFAKSAATIIALGADKILMSKTAELGAIDPQLILNNPIEKGRFVRESTVNGVRDYREEKIFENSVAVIPVFRIVKAVETLLADSKKLFGFNRSVFKHFIGQYGYDTFAMAKNEFKLNEDILKKILERKREKYNVTQKFINDCRIFFDPEITLSHNRPITLLDLESSELYKTQFVECFIDYFSREKKLGSDVVNTLDSLLWEYHTRTNIHLEDDGNPVVKTIESSSNRFHLLNTGGYSLS